MSLAQLFSMGRSYKVFKIKGVEFRLVLLDTRILSQALEAASMVEGEVAQSLEFKKQVLARALTNVDGQQCIDNEDEPTSVEVNATIDGVLNKLHVSIVNGLYSEYEKMNVKLTKEVEADLKNS